MKHFRLLLAVVGASVLLGALATAASAGRLSISNQRFRATWAALNFGGAFGTVTCAITVEGSLHTRTINKIAGTLVGFITGASAGVCSRGSVTILRETLPWHTVYSSFTGTLPNITGVVARAIGITFLLREPTFGITCLARSTAESAAVGTFNRETATGVATSITSSGGFPCEGLGPGEYSGSTSSFVNETGGRITITLI